MPTARAAGQGPAEPMPAQTFPASRSSAATARPSVVVVEPPILSELRSLVLTMVALVARKQNRVRRTKNFRGGLFHQGGGGGTSGRPRGGGFLWPNPARRVG